MDLSIFKYKDYFKTNGLDIKESIKVDGFRMLFDTSGKIIKIKNLKKNFLYL